MAVEVFLIEDSEKMIADPEHLEEWQSLVSDLNLEGQKTLQNKENVSPIPFPMLKKGEERVYEILCPNKTVAQKYGNNTIPLRVLSLLALAEKEKYFNFIEIWDDCEKPDPIAIGVVGANSWQGKKYIIARWGDELRPYAELKALAIKRLIENKTIEWKKEIKVLESKLEQIDIEVADYLNGNGWTL